MAPRSRYPRGGRGGPQAHPTSTLPTGAEDGTSRNSDLAHRRDNQARRAQQAGRQGNTAEAQRLARAAAASEAARRRLAGGSRSGSGGSSGSPSGSPAADAVTSTSSGGGTTGGTSTGSSTTSTSGASIPKGPTTPKAGTAKPKKGTVLAKALGSQKGLKKGDEGTFAGYGKKDRNMALSFVQKNYKWARKDGNEQRARDVAGYLLGKEGGPFTQDGANGKLKLSTAGTKAKGQSRKPPKGVSDKEFKREVAKYKATHKAARDPEKAKNVEAIVATILRGRQKKKPTSTTKPNPVDGSKTPPPSPSGGADTPPKERPALTNGPVDPNSVRGAVTGNGGIGNPAGYAPGTGKEPWRPGQKGPKKTGRHLPSGGPDRPPTPKKKRPKPGSGVKRSHSGRIIDSQ